VAKTAGAQSIPSALLDAYRATLGEQRPALSIQKRYPWRLKQMRAGGSGETVKQRLQRARFKVSIDQFKTLTTAERARWYAAMPPYSSLLWYYNYFILSDIMDVLGADARGASVIKSIQNRTLLIPLAGTTITHATVIDSSKAVAMLWGAGYNFTYFEAGENAWASPSWPVYPIWGTLNNTNISLTWTVNPTVAAQISLQVIEYL
jgi:hypothetical protein